MSTNKPSPINTELSAPTNNSQRLAPLGRLVNFWR